MSGSLFFVASGRILLDPRIGDHRPGFGRTMCLSTVEGKKKESNLSGTYVIHGHKAPITTFNVFSGKPNHKEFGPKNLASFVGTRPTLPVVRGILGFRSVRSFSICQSRSPQGSSRPTRGIMAGRGSRPPPMPAAGGGSQYQQGGQRPPAPRAPQPFDAPPPRGGGGGY
jgi:hypothetical protein